jgi:putative holliday junction resolvase
MSMVLGFDYGTKVIGVALGETETAQARPLTAIVRKNRQADWGQIGGLITEWEPECFVVGMPFDADGSEQEMSCLTRKFIQRLEGRYALPVHSIDERYSSLEAQRIIRERKWKQEKVTVDMVAASIILQSWFDHVGN